MAGGGVIFALTGHIVEETYQGGSLKQTLTSSVPSQPARGQMVSFSEEWDSRFAIEKYQQKLKENVEERGAVGSRYV